MVLEPVCCPQCHKTNVVKNGKSGEGKQRDRCRNDHCARASFILDYTYRGYIPEVKAQVSELAMNGSGSRDTARVLRISPTTVMEDLKKTSSPGIGESERVSSVLKFTANCSDNTG
ncbi:MAG: IS1 family transposase [Leptolyngbya sp. SIOISBB]|nr:IS1 family transposase [Leptolyngbya sp. SIOISBB]